MQDVLHDRGRLGWGNILLALAVLGLSFFALRRWAIPGVDPSLWNELSVVTGLRPPQTVFPGYWRAVMCGLIHVFGISRTMELLPWLGAGVGAVSAALYFLVVRQVLSFEIRTTNRYAVWSRFIAPFFSLFATGLFIASEPLAQCSQVLTPDGMQMALCLFCIYLIFRWLLRGGLVRVFVAHLLAGLLAAETFFGFLLPVFSVVAYSLTVRKISEGQLTRPEKFVDPYDVPRWILLVLFFLGLTAGIVVELNVFESFCGPEANGWRTGTALFRFVISYCTTHFGAASLLGWLLALNFSVVPFLLGIWIAPRAISDEHRMPFGLGFLLLFVGAAAVMQSGAFPYARFWTFDLDSMSVQSGFLLEFFTLLDFCALAVVGAAFTFECQRTYVSAERERAREALEDDRFTDDGESRAAPVMWMDPSTDRPACVLLRCAMPLAAVIVLAGAIWQAPQPIKVEMQRIVDDAIREIVDECGDARWLFTDGRLDAAIELESQRRGRTLYALNMMSDSTPWAVSVRRRGFESSSNDCVAVETGVPVLFRTWAERTNGFDRAAFQFGFEYWQRERSGMPRLSGLVGRTKGLDERAANEGVMRTRALARRILSVPELHLNMGTTMAFFRTFSAVSWRIARLAEFREERELADRLNERNDIMKRITNAIERERQRTFMQLTPKEGLRLALQRTDFAEARRHAMVILNEDDRNLEANFAMAMGAVTAGQLRDAEVYLRKCRSIQPREPSVLNNLSIVCRRLGRYDEALELARQAAVLMPDAPEIRRTLTEAENAKNGLK